MIANYWRRVLDSILGVLVHGVLWSVIRPVIGWLGWIALAVALGLATAAYGWFAARFPRTARVAVALYALVVGIMAFGQWGFAALHSPWWAVLGALGVGWLGLLALTRHDVAATLVSSLAMAALGLWAARAAETSLAAATAVLVPSVLVWLAAGFAQRLRTVGALLFTIFLTVWFSTAVNHVFLRGPDYDIEHLINRDGVTPILIWRNRPAYLRGTIGTDVRWTMTTLADRLVFGGDNGVHLLEPSRLREIPVGAAGDNLAVDPERRRAYLINREGTVFVLANEAMAITAQAQLPGEGGTARVAAEGVYAATRSGHVAFLDRYNAKIIDQWDVGPWPDIIPDGRGGLFVAAANGAVRLLHTKNDITGTLPFWGVRHHLAFDKEGRRLFATSILDTRLRIFEAANLQDAKTVDIGLGGSAVHWDEQTGSVVVGRYFAGELVVVDGDGEREIGRLRVGRRLTSVAANGPGRVLVTSAGGVFVIDLAEAFPELRAASQDAS
ncbi:MAG: hypothetical protein P9L99_16350 [Candidatus Lernaella stagnicola]|nr:hypothetical protein [Candidatus Lernaella stagnicola]